MPPGRGDIPTFSPAKDGTRFNDPDGCRQGCRHLHWGYLEQIKSPLPPSPLEVGPLIDKEVWGSGQAPPAGPGRARPPNVFWRKRKGEGMEGEGEEGEGTEKGPTCKGRGGEAGEGKRMERKGMGWRGREG